jgi:rRNA maturation endonuclease Nob1
MNCSNCNKQIPDDSEFCIFCGEKIDYLPNQNASVHKQKHNQINKIKQSCRFRFKSAG